MTNDLRTRIAAVLRGYLLDHFIVDMEQAQGLWPEYLADAVIRELGAIPDREFTDQWGHHWEWCGGVTGTWAWRITRLERTP